MPTRPGVARARPARDQGSIRCPANRANHWRMPSSTRSDYLLAAAENVDPRCPEDKPRFALIGRAIPGDPPRAGGKGEVVDRDEHGRHRPRTEGIRGGIPRDDWAHRDLVTLGFHIEARNCLIGAPLDVPPSLTQLTYFLVGVTPGWVALAVPDGSLAVPDDWPLGAAVAAAPPPLTAPASPSRAPVITKAPRALLVRSLHSHHRVHRVLACDQISWSIVRHSESKIRPTTELATNRVDPTQIVRNRPPRQRCRYNR